MQDNYLWLEEVESQKSLNWIHAQNEKSDEYFKNNRFYSSDCSIYEKSFLSKDRLPQMVLHKDWFYSVLQNTEHPQGVWRRISVDNYLTKADQWQIILDLDHLSQQENKKWFLSRFNFLLSGELALLGLSNGGSDAVFWKEFDLQKLSFVIDGFSLPESKSHLGWYDENTVIFADALTSGSQTVSGYARQLRVWRRGEAFSESSVLYSIAEGEFSLSMQIDQSQKNMLIFHGLNFTKIKIILVKDLRELLPLNLPYETDAVYFFKNRLFVRNLKDWLFSDQTLKAGSLISWPLADLHPQSQNIQIHFSPSSAEVLSDYFLTENFLLILKLKNIQPQITCFQYSEGGFFEKTIAWPDKSVVNLAAASHYSDKVLWRASDFLQPAQLIFTDLTGPIGAPYSEGSQSFKAQVVQQLTTQFDTSNFIKEQLWAISKDGDKIPYFVVRRKDFKFNGESPAWITGYGGFESPMLPYDLGALGAAWLEGANGFYVLANIRGGGEFGPHWHQNAILQHKQKSYDDFIAVTEDLISRQMTSKNKISIHGASNGGLLVAAVAMQRPDLFKAVVCMVPLLDMLRYHKLLAGASWMAEYGNPDIETDRTFIEKYSPYQNIKIDQQYPSFFIYTSTKDDRVHPGHARKMVARLLEYNNDVIYYEQAEGGHKRDTSSTSAAQLFAKFSAFTKDKVLG